MSDRISHDDLREAWKGHPLIGRAGDGQDGIYVGRIGGGPFGNPFKITPRTDRDTSVERYRAWLKEQIREDYDRWVPLLAALYDERLVCHCAPLRCHAEVLVVASIWAWSEMGMPEHLAEDAEVAGG